MHPLTSTNHREELIFRLYNYSSKFSIIILDWLWANSGGVGVKARQSLSWFHSNELMPPHWWSEHRDCSWTTKELSLLLVFDLWQLIQATATVLSDHIRRAEPLGGKIRQMVRRATRHSLAFMCQLTSREVQMPQTSWLRDEAPPTQNLMRLSWSSGLGLEEK